MSKSRLSPVVLLLVMWLIITILVRSVAAAQDTIVIAAGQEVSEPVDAVPGCVSICGNMSVLNGTLNFYATSPTGKILFSCNKTSFTDFNITTTENGTYTLHLKNAFSQDNVTAMLCYGKNLQLFFQSTISMTSSAVTMWTYTRSVTLIVPQSPPYLFRFPLPSRPWIELGDARFLALIVTVILAMISGALLLGYNRKRAQSEKTDK